MAYGASKYALESYSLSAACELGAYGITVNVVAPGPTQTGYITPEAETSLLRNIPLGRLGQPEDIAEAILGVVRSPYMTGEIVLVDGGLSLVS